MWIATKAHVLSICAQLYLLVLPILLHPSLLSENSALSKVTSLTLLLIITSLSVSMP